MARPFRCPHCNCRLKLRPEQWEQLVQCPKCHEKFKAPAEPQADSPRRSADSGAPFEKERETALSRPSMKIDPEELIDMTAMVDIVFFLLIFFLVTSMSGIQSSAPLPRPESHDDEKGAARTTRDEDPQNDPNAIVVKINKDDSIEIDGVPYRDNNDLIDRLKQLRSTGGSSTSMLVIGHGEATHGTAVSVLDDAYEVGIEHLRFAVIADGTE